MFCSVIVVVVFVVFAGNVAECWADSCFKLDGLCQPMCKIMGYHAKWCIVVLGGSCLHVCSTNEVTASNTPVFFPP